MLQLAFKAGSTGTVDLNKTRITIGRDQSNDLVLTAPGVSGFHAEIQNEGGRSFLVDLGSTNGTFINGKRISGRQELNAWDAVQFDKVEAEVVDGEGRRPTMVNRAVSSADLTPGVAAEVGKGPVSVSGWSLQGQSGSTAGKRFEIATKLSVGRESSCDLTLEVSEVSRRHAELELTGGVLKLKDLDSANGTFVNGRKVTETVLKSGDEVRFDQVAFRVNGPVSAAQTSVRPAVSPAVTQVRSAPAATQVNRATVATPSSQVTQAGPAVTVTQSAALPQAKLIGSGGAVAGKNFPLNKQQLAIGRTEGNDIVIADPTVSGIHARLLVENGGWKIEDAGSSNGTWINGKKVQSQVMKAGDKVRFGQVELAFEGTAAAASKTAAGTQVMGAVGTSAGTAVMPAVKKTFPAWGYGLIGFVVVAIGVGAFFWKSGPRQIDAKLGAGKVWQYALPDNRTASATPVIADINGDDLLDVMVADDGGYVLALSGPGSKGEGQRIFEAHTEDRIVAPPVAGDLDGDGIADVVVASILGQVTAINGEGKSLWRSPASLEAGSIINRPVLHDVTGDGLVDVILPTAAKGLVALDGKHGWQLWNTGEMSKGRVITSPVKADIDGDGHADFISVTDSGQVMALTGAGEKVWQLWEAQVPSVSYASPLYFEAGDRGLVVVATDRGGIVALDAKSGRVFWQAKSNERFIASPVATDANGDKVPDVIAIAESGVIRVLDSLTGDEIWARELGVGVQASPALFDINGDGFNDIVLLDASGQMQIIDMTRGRTVLSKQVTTGNGFLASPVLADLNNDKLLEIVATAQNGEIVTYGINRLAKRGSQVWAQFLGNDQHSIQ